MHDSSIHLWPHLGNLGLLDDAETRSISAENPDGRRGGGARAHPEDGSPARRLGKGWKARPFIPIAADTTVTIAEIDGPGIIQHIWITTDEPAYSGLILRMYWDDESTPSVAVPLGDFFACGHGCYRPVQSAVVAVNPRGGLNCYWPMPFHKSARITVENATGQDLPHFFYQITYALRGLPGNAATFHAQWRQSRTTSDCPEHVLLDGVEGRGHYVGTYLAWTQFAEGWWGEGEVKFFLDDDDADHPTICGTGTEDYFGGAWSFYDEHKREVPYSGPYLGLPLVLYDGDRPPRFGMYRWHVPDPIRFRSRLRATVQALGWWPDNTFRPLEDEIASTAFWYQQEPHAPFPTGPGAL